MYYRAFVRSGTKIVPFKLLFKSNSPAKMDKANPRFLVLKCLFESHVDIVSPTLKSSKNRSVAPFRFLVELDTITTWWYDEVVNVFGVIQFLESHIGKGKAFHIHDRIV